MPLHRGRGLHHVRKVGIGTQEARPGPTDASSSGALCKGEPECSAELRSGVGSAHSTFEAAEGNEAVEGRGRLEGMPSERGRSPDAEPGRSKKIPRELGWGSFYLVNLREEPGAGKPHAGIREGEAEWPIYSTTNSSSRISSSV